MAAMFHGSHHHPQSVVIRIPYISKWSLGTENWTGPRAGAAAMAVRACSACLHVEKKMCTVLFVQHYLLCINALL